MRRNPWWGFGVGFGVVFALVLGVAALRAGDPDAVADADGKVVRIGQGRYLGAAIHERNMTVWPVYSESEVAALRTYHTLEQAQEKSLVVVRELDAGRDTPAAEDGAGGEAQVIPVDGARGGLRAVTPDDVQVVVEEGDSAEAPESPDASQEESSAPQEQPIQDISNTPPQRDDREQVQEDLRQELQQMREQMQRQQEEIRQQMRQPRQQQRGGGAQVSVLVVENKGEIPILILAGTIIKGGKQDRLIGRDYIIPPQSSIRVDTFCVEQGRWSDQREGKDTGGVFEGKRPLAVHSSRVAGQFKRQQGEVWEAVGRANMMVGGRVPATGTIMAVIEVDDKEVLERRGALTEKIVAPFTAEGGARPVGIAYAIDGEIREMRVFAHPDLLLEYLPQIAATIAIEADLSIQHAGRAGASVHEEAADPGLIPARLREIEAAAEERVRTEGLNMNIYQRAERAASSRAFEMMEGEARDAVDEDAVTEVYNFF